MPKKVSALPEKPIRPRNVTGRRIQAVRMAAAPKISQEDLAGRVSVRGVPLSQEQIAKIESGRRPVMDYELIAIAKALRVPVQSLLPVR